MRSKNPAVAKACAIVIRTTNSEPELLVFKHPLAGIQIVKGSIEQGESVARAAERELLEEAGISLATEKLISSWVCQQSKQQWGVCLMASGNHLSDTWSHFCLDDGGHNFSFFWHPLSTGTDAQWHPIFSALMSDLQSLLQESTNHAH